MSDNKSFLLVEQYRPDTIDECILPVRIKDKIKQFVSKGQIPHLMFYGTAGLGKTSLAYAICNEINADYIYINASSENSIDVVRNKISQFASTASFEGNLKVVILDEADRLSSAAMDSLKSVQEQFHQSTRFIFTSNNIHKIIDPIRSRCIEFDFNPTDSEKQELLVLAMKRVVSILKKEEIKFDIPAVAGLVKKYYPDLRKTLNEIQRYSASGQIDSGVLVAPNTTIDELVVSMRGKKLNDIRKWLARNSDFDPTSVFRYFYDNLDMFVPQSIPNIILILAQYQSYSAVVVDQEINMAACLVEVCQAAEWKNA